MKKNSHKDQLRRRTRLTIWDEAPMINRFAIEAFDRSLRDIMKSASEGEHASHVPDISFGGKAIVFGGDFRQILSVVPRGSRPDIVNASINSSLLWSNCQVLRLTQNMRIQFCSDQAQNVAIKEFADGF